jgi:hypothetical protein
VTVSPALTVVLSLVKLVMTGAFGFAVGLGVGVGLGVDEPPQAASTAATSVALRHGRGEEGRVPARAGDTE